MTTVPWKVSLHGGHTGQFCDHATGTLRETIEAAIAFGYHTFGVAEHAARTEPRHLYREEIALGWDIDKIQQDFRNYAREVRKLATEYQDRITLLCGFEAEVVPADRYAEIMLGYRRDLEFDYMVASAHYVGEWFIDYEQSMFDKAVEAMAGLEPLVVAYFRGVAEMVEALRPEVVGHFDVVRKFAAPHGSIDTPATRRAVSEALEVIREHDGILDVNVGAYRKGKRAPYPAAWIVQQARELGIPFCFGDDSHGPKDVGQGIARGREYLIENGVFSITTLTREATGLGRKVISLI